MNVEQMTNEEMAQYMTMHHTIYHKLTYEEWRELDAEAASRLRAIDQLQARVRELEGQREKVIEVVLMYDLEIEKRVALKLLKAVNAPAHLIALEGGE